MNRLKRILTILLVAVITVAGADAQRSRSKSKSKSKAGTTQTVSKKKSGKKSSVNKTSKKPQTKAELQRQQQATQQEIAETKRKIAENERQVSHNLAELTKLQQDIKVSQGKVSESSRRVNLLQGQINQLQGQISAEQKEIERLRNEYLKAVKAVRKRKNTNSNLAYIFSAGSFADGARRMRYLSEFSEWRGKQTSDIQGKIKDLEGKKQKLAQNKAMYDKALAVNVSAQRSLEIQYGQQNRLVTELKANGSALRSHLAKKQQEVNSLKNRVAALIAAEQAEAERKAAAERRAAEQRAREESERQRQQELAQEQSKKTGQSEKEQPKKKEEPKKKEQSKKEQSKKEQTGKSYADARRRRPRGDKNQGSVPPVTKTESSSKSSAAGFASMRGSLPRPVAGAFRVTSLFGVHSLPDLPDVKYDNPGIDAEVARGASAQAVYTGKVSGVYMIPGFSTVVIVNHGEYYTVYGNLASAGVRVGDVVKAGQSVGTVAESEDNPGHGQIHFEVWKNREKQDPMAWIR